MNFKHIIIFKNTHDAIGCEAYFKSEGIFCRVMPTPTTITQSCGISLIINDEDLDVIRNLIVTDKIKVKGIYKRDGVNFIEV